MRSLVGTSIGCAVLLLSLEASAAPTTYTSRATFDTAFPGLTVEAFQGLASYAGCPSPLSTATANNNCFNQGALRAGFVFGGVDSHPTDGVGLGDGPTGRYIQTSYYADTSVLTLSPAQYVVGFDVLVADSGGVLSNATTATVTVYDEANGVIATQDVGSQTFFGIRSDVLIGSVRILKLGTYTEGIDNLVFGPTFASVAPATGGFRGGSPVTLTGEGFAAGTTVSFDGAAATNVVVTGGKSITCVAPAHAAATVGVALTTSGVTLTKAASFTYVAHTATAALALTPKTPRYHDEPNAFTATVTGTDPTGEVALMEGAAELAKTALAGGGADGGTDGGADGGADGGVTFSVTLPAGMHSVFARYKGDPFHAPVDSTPVAVDVEMRPEPIVDSGTDTGASSGSDSGTTTFPTPDARASIDDGEANNQAAPDNGDSGCSTSGESSPAPFGAAIVMIVIAAKLAARRRRR